MSLLVRSERDARRVAKLRAGARAGIPFAFAAAAMGASFGVLARDVGMPIWATVLMSALMFAGSAQFAAMVVLGGGGTMGSALGAAALIHSRFLPMGIVLAPSLPGGPVRRAAQGQAMVDASWVTAFDGSGRFDRGLLFGSTAIQYVAWIVGTAIGAFGGDAIGDLEMYGLDAVYPAFFLALLVGEVRAGRRFSIAAVGALIAFLLVPITPPGVPVLVASSAALLALVGRARGGALHNPEELS